MLGSIPPLSKKKEEELTPLQYLRQVMYLVENKRLNEFFRTDEDHRELVQKLKCSERQLYNWHY